MIPIAEPISIGWLGNTFLIDPQAAYEQVVANREMDVEEVRESLTFLKALELVSMEELIDTRPFLKKIKECEELLTSGKMDDAAKSLVNLISFSESFPSVLRRRFADLMSIKGRLYFPLHEQAVQKARVVLKSRPKPQLTIDVVALDRDLKESGKPPLAIGDCLFEKALELFMSAEEKKDVYHTIIALCERALTLIPQNETRKPYALYFILARSYQGVGEDEKAIEFWSRALKNPKVSNKKRIQIKINIADIYAAIGNYHAAALLYAHIGKIVEEKTGKIFIRAQIFLKWRTIALILGKDESADSLVSAAVREVLNFLGPLLEQRLQYKMGDEEETKADLDLVKKMAASSQLDMESFYALWRIFIAIMYEDS